MSNVKFGVSIPVSNGTQLLVMCSCGHNATLDRPTGNITCEKCGNEWFTYSDSTHKTIKVKLKDTYEIIHKDESSFIFEKKVWHGTINKTSLTFTVQAIDMWTLHYSWKTKEVIKLFHNGEEFTGHLERPMIDLFKSFSNEEMLIAISTDRNITLHRMALKRLSNQNMERAKYFGRALLRLRKYPALQILSACGASERLLSDYEDRPHIRSSKATTPADILGIPKYTVSYVLQEEIYPSNYARYSEKPNTIDTMHNAFGGHNTKELFKIFYDESTIRGLLNTVDLMIQLYIEYGYKNILQLGIYLARKVKLEQGIYEPSEAARLLRDYIKMSRDLGHTYDTYPKSLKKDHDITSMNYKIAVNETKEKEFQEVIHNETYQELIYKHKDFVIAIPQTIKNVVQEGKNLSHCVASYVNDIIKQKCIIVFMRYAHAIEESLITIEVRNNEIKQVKGFGNRLPTGEEKDFVRKWAMRKSLVCSY